MDVLRAALSLPLLACLAAPAAAQTVYRCRSGDTWAYQDRPCSHAQAAGTHTIRATPGGATPPAVQQMLDQQAAKSDQARIEAARAAEYAAQEPAAPTSPPRRKGYRCTAGRGFDEYVVYQTEPCPDMLHTGTLYITRTTDYGPGRSYTDSAVVPIMEKSEQKEISAREACKGRRSQQDPYERYKNPVPCP